MSSRRFPGKVLAPLQGRPLIRHLLDRAATVLMPSHIVVATSTDASDDPLAGYVADLGYPVFRGPLDSVFDRFRACLEVHPADWFFRICADSPFLDPALMRRMLAFVELPGADLVTNVFPRTYPRGRSLELINGATFLEIDRAARDRHELEHPTQVYYRTPEAFRIVNLKSERPDDVDRHLAVDTVGDLHRLAAYVDDAPAALTPRPETA